MRITSISSTASATVMIADFVNVDAVGKVNIIGGGIQPLGLNPVTGLTASFSVFVNVTVSIPLFSDSAAAVEMVLVNTDGQPVTVAGPERQGIMRFTQDLDFRFSGEPNIQQPPLGFPGSSNMVLNFSGGLPLNAGETYEWDVLLDQRRLSSITFFVAGAETQ
ncbi:hypothetical protein [Arthrobacter alpinus]|uniref:hypothetical protein n=1 Tax=Arthrobacter alpinus TaxID=656366 RepID=UPI0012F848D5|nr:hypothetical protein [Arthrobacter alpinus]